MRASSKAETVIDSEAAIALLIVGPDAGAVTADDDVAEDAQAEGDALTDAAPSEEILPTSDETVDVEAVPNTTAAALVAGKDDSSPTERLPPIGDIAAAATPTRLAAPSRLAGLSTIAVGSLTCESASCALNLSMVLSIVFAGESDFDAAADGLGSLGFPPRSRRFILPTRGMPKKYAILRHVSQPHTF